MRYEDVKNLPFPPLRRKENRLTNTSNIKTWFTNITVSGPSLRQQPQKSHNLLKLKRNQGCRLRVKCDGTRAETRFLLSAKRMYESI